MPSYFINDSLRRSTAEDSAVLHCLCFLVRSAHGIGDLYAVDGAAIVTDQLEALAVGGIEEHPAAIDIVVVRVGLLGATVGEEGNARCSVQIDFVCQDWLQNSTITQVKTL